MRRILPGIGTIALACALLVSAPLAGQTIGIPFTNDLFVDIGAVGAPAGPPFGAPCPSPPIAIPPLIPFSLNVTTLAPGLVVIPVINVSIPCAPGIAVPPVCLPPVFGPYGIIPPVAGPCGPFTNQTYDLAPIPPLGPLPAFIGASFLFPGTPGGMYMSPAITSPGGGGLPISVQAIIFDPLGAGALGMVVTNAVDIILL